MVDYDDIEYLKRKGKAGEKFAKIQDYLYKLKEGEYFDLFTHLVFNDKEFNDLIVKTNIIPEYIKGVTPRLHIIENGKLLEDLLELKKEDESLLNRGLVLGGEIFAGEYYIAILGYDKEKGEGETYLLWRDFNHSGLSKISTWNKEALDAYEKFLNKYLKELFKNDDLDMYQ